MHVSGGERLYRSAFRRDFPTDQPFPNLWPWRIRIQNYTLFGFPWSDFVTFQEAVSAPAEYLPDGKGIRYKWTVSGFFDTIICTMHCKPGPQLFQQFWDFVFESPGHFGFSVLTCDAYILDIPDVFWKVTSPMPGSRCTLTNVGDFADVTFDGDDPLIEMYAALWSEIPEAERNP